MSLLDSLSHYWALEESSGTRYDSHGTKHLTPRAVGSAAGQVGNAAAFSTVDDSRLHASGILAPTPGTYTSVSLWFRLPATGGWGDLFSPGGGQAFRLYVDSSYRVIAEGKSIQFGWVKTIASSPVTLGVWHHVCWICGNGTSGGGEGGVLYIDGVLVGSEPDMFASYTSNASVYYCTIGNIENSFGSGGAALDGDIDEVGLWMERRFTEADVSELYNGGNGLSYADLSGPAEPPIELTVTEALTLSDSGIASALFSAALSESLVLTAAHSGAVVRLGAIVEPLSLASTQAATAEIGASLAETLALAATHAGGTAIVAAVAEMLALSEASSQVITKEAVLVEALTLSESAASILVAYASTSELLTLAAQEIASALRAAGITEVLAISTTTDGQRITTDVTLADGRTLTVALENRTFTVQAESRTFTAQA